MSCQLAAHLCEPFDIIWVTENKRRTDPIVTLEEATKIGRKVSKRVGEAAEHNVLNTHQGIALILKVWATFGDAGAVRSFVDSRLNYPQDAINFAFANMATVSTTAKPYEYRELREKVDETIFNARKIADALERFLDLDKVPVSDRDDIDRFVKQARGARDFD